MHDEDATPSADTIVEAHWPFGGPHTEESVESAAEAMCGLARYLVNALWTVSPSAPSLRRLLSFLVTADHRVGEVLEMLVTEAHRLAQDPTLFDERRDRPGSQTAIEVVEHINDAQVRYSGGRGALEKAWAAASYLGHDTVPVGDPR